MRAPMHSHGLYTILSLARCAATALLCCFGWRGRCVLATHSSAPPSADLSIHTTVRNPLRPESTWVDLVCAVRHWYRHFSSSRSFG